MAMLVFDLDDTLYLEREFAFGGYRAVADYLRQNLQLEGVEQACRERFERGEFQFIFNSVLRELNVSCGADLIARLVQVYRSHPPELSLCDDVKRFLDHYHGRVNMAVITDGPDGMQRRKIAALGLAPFLSHIRPTYGWGQEFSKPHPRAFEEVEALGYAPAELTYVADNPAKDFVTPKARGWRTVQITRPGAVHNPNAPDAAHQADYQITTFDDLPALLGADVA